MYTNVFHDWSQVAILTNKLHDQTPFRNRKLKRSLAMQCKYCNASAAKMHCNIVNLYSVLAQPQKRCVVIGSAPHDVRMVRFCRYTCGWPCHIFYQMNLETGSEATQRMDHSSLHAHCILHSLYIVSQSNISHQRQHNSITCTELCLYFISRSFTRTQKPIQCPFIIKRFAFFRHYSYSHCWLSEQHNFGKMQPLYNSRRIGTQYMPKTPNNEHLLQQHCIRVQYKDMCEEDYVIGEGKRWPWQGVVLADAGCGSSGNKSTMIRNKRKIYVSLLHLTYPI